MKPRSILTIGLLAVFMLVACAPAASPTPAQTELPVQPAPQETEPPALPTTAPTEVQPPAAQTEVPPTEAPTEIPQIVATSRGPDLEATDPATVSLASGELQLVEFFRFT
jgi:hypothetical protein